ncbi:MAG: VOC family protein [Pseudomonadota bacterium]
MPNYSAGKNIAMKLPERSYAQTVGFYEDVLGLEIVDQDDDGTIFKFGEVFLNLDRVPLQSQTDIWLELVVDDIAAAQADLSAQGVTLCDEVEALPDGFEGFWIASPSSTIHLVGAESNKQTGA